MDNKLKRLWILPVFLVAGVFPFYPYWAGATSFFTYHALSGLLPLKYQIAKSFMAGEYPLWNPWVLNGTPFHSGIGILDPFLASFLVLDGVHALMASSYLALCFAGLTMYLYLRKIWGFSVPAALLGGLFYLANPFFAATCHENPFMNPPVFLPLIFYFYETAIRDRRLWKALLSGIFLGLAFLAGNLESFCLIGIFFGTFECGHIIVRFLEDRSREEAKVRLRCLATAGLAALFFMAVDLLPTVAMVFNSERSLHSTLLQNTAHFVLVGGGAVLCAWLTQQLASKGPAWQCGVKKGLLLMLLGLFAVRFDWHAHIAHFNTNLFYPLVQQVMIRGQESFHLLWYETNAARETLAAFLEPRFIFYIQPPIYLFTLATFILFAVVFIKAQNLWLKTLCWYAVLFVVFPYTSVPNLNVYALGLKSIAYPRLMFAFFFVQAIVIASGFQNFVLARDAKQAGQIPKGVVAAAAALTLLSFVIFLFCLCRRMEPQHFLSMLETLRENSKTAGWWAKSWNHLGLTLETLSFLFRKGGGVAAAGALKWLSGAALLFVWFRPSQKAAYVLLALLTFEFLGQWNLYAFQKADIQYLTRASAESQFLSQRGADERTGTLEESVKLPEFYDQDRRFLLHDNMPGFWSVKTIEGSALNLAPALFSRFWALEPENNYSPTVLTVIPRKIYDLMGMHYLFSHKTVQDRSYRLILSGDYYQIYKNTNALPRFYFARSVRAETEAAIGAQIRNAVWSPADVTLIESKVPNDWVRARRITAQPGAIATLRERHNTLRLRTQSESSEFLATTEAYHAHWKVYVDGKKRKPVKTNYYFRGVFLAPGEHEVEFRYEDPSFMLGAGITFGFLIFFGWVVIRERTKGFLPVSRHG